MAAINLKAWLIFSEPNAACQQAVEWKKPSTAFLKAWKTKAIPVTIRPARLKKGAR